MKVQSTCAAVKPFIQSINAITLATRDMASAVQFYCSLGFTIRHGGHHATFTTLEAGLSCLNLIAHQNQGRHSWWGRVIFYVSNVDALYDHARSQGLHPDTVPTDASWGERFFHITDPDGHELSFAKPLLQN